MTQRPTASGFVEALLAAAAARDPRREIEQRLRQFAGERIRIPVRLFDPLEPAADLARTLLAAGVGRQTAVAIVAERRGCSRRHARRLVAKAADSRGQAVSVKAATVQPCDTPRMRTGSRP